jgi:hypothetical protein
LKRQAGNGVVVRWEAGWKIREVVGWVVPTTAQP